MRRFLSFAFILGILVSIFCCGCTANNNEKNYTFNLDIYRSKILSNYTKYRVYIKGDKWRQEEFRGNSSTPYLISLFDGKDYYVKGAEGVPVKVNAYSKEILLTKNEAYPLLNWNKNTDSNIFSNIFLFFKTEPQKIGEHKSKYGYGCTLYKYGPWTDCNKNNVCTTSIRNVCVDDNNIAMSIELQTNVNSIGSYNRTLNIVDMNTKVLDDNIFKVSNL